jgi:hypothetical protein
VSEDNVVELMLVIATSCFGDVKHGAHACAATVPYRATVAAQKYGDYIANVSAYGEAPAEALNSFVTPVL